MKFKKLFSLLTATAMIFSSTTIINAQELNTEVVEAKMLSSMKEEIVLMAETDVPVDKFELVETSNGDKILQYAELTDDDLIKVTSLTPYITMGDELVNSFDLISSSSYYPLEYITTNYHLNSNLVVTSTAYYKKHTSRGIEPIYLEAKYTGNIDSVTKFQFYFVTKGAYYKDDIYQNQDKIYTIVLNVISPTKNILYMNTNDNIIPNSYLLLYGLSDYSYSKIIFNIDFISDGENLNMNDSIILMSNDGNVSSDLEYFTN